MGSRGLVAAVIVACMSALTVTAAHGASPTDKINPAVAGSSKGALVVWEDWRTGHADIYGARVDVNGKVLDPGGRLIAGAVPCAGARVVPNDCDLTHPDVVWTGSDYVVGFQTVDVDQSLEIDWWVHVDTNGNVIGTPSQFAAGYGADFALAVSGSTYVGAWVQEDLHGFNRVLVSFPAGNEVTTVTVAFSDQVTPETTRFFAHVDAAGGSGGFLLAYESKPFAENQDPFDIEVAKVGLDKTVSGKQLVTQTPSTEHAPAVAWNGNKWLVAWEDHRGANADIYGARIDANVNVLDPGGDPISTASGDQLAPAATANGTTFYVAWSDWRTGSTADVYGQRVTGLGRRLNGLGGFPISRQPATQQLPDLARLGSNVVTVWQDNRAGSWDVYGTRVSATKVLTWNGFVIAS